MDQLLIVDDNEINVQLLQSYLKQKGYMVRSAKNGLEAIEQVIKFNPDLILMDLQMPEMDGFEFLKKFNQINHTKYSAKTLFLVDQAFLSYSYEIYIVVS